jgi:acyl-CoA hydrolase
MDWIKKHGLESRVMTHEQAVKMVKSGDRVIVGHGTAYPLRLVQAMCARKDELFGVEVMHPFIVGAAPHCAPEMEGHFRHVALFIGPMARQAIQEGRADYIPVFLHQNPSLFVNGICPIDVGMVQVTPPDDHGFCSYGVSIDVTKPGTDAAKIVLAEINPQMPRTLGDSFIHIDRINAFIPVDHPIPELPLEEVTDTLRKIGANVASLIEDGSVIQMGIGGLPNAIVQFLAEKKDLGIHSEMLSDGVAELFEKGVVTCARKTLHRGKIVGSFAMGTQKIYKFIDNNPMVQMYPVDYTNHPFIVAQNERMVAINSAIQVSVTGQVNAESIGWKMYSGIGGQVDFFRGATMAKDGKAVIALPSTAAGGKVSRIVPNLDLGSIVTTSRYDVRYIVTEYGVADLFGVTERERARRMIAVAHPDFRPWLTEEAEKQGRNPHYKNYVEA